MKKTLLIAFAIVASFALAIGQDDQLDGVDGVDKYMNKVCEKTNSDGTPAAGCEAPDANGPCCTKVDCPR